MTEPQYEAQLHRLARVLARIAHTLEAVDDARARVERTLQLLSQIVPYSRCAVLEVSDDDTYELYAVPVAGDDERREVERSMLDVLHVLARGHRIERAGSANSSLALPLIGLDSTIGVIRVEPDGTVYDATHLRILSVVAAQLGAFLTTLRLRDRDRKREARLAAAHDFQQLLAGIVSHDLRNPLSVITAVASNLLAKSTDDKQAESLRRALRNAQQAARLISDLTDVTEARVSGSVALVPSARMFAGWLTEAVEDLRSAHPSSTIELVCDVPDALEVMWDLERVNQVLTNLVSNALAHGAVGFPVRVAAWSDAQGLVLSVHNYGPRISPELMPHIFDPFTHGMGSRSRAHGARGLGLGLFIVGQIAKAHGGSVSVTSDDLDGTTFKVRLPRTTTAGHARLMPARSLDGLARSVVLVVVDEAAVREGLTSALEKRGFDVIAAADGVEALDVLRRGVRPKLILLDLAGPGTMGEELSQELARDPALVEIPVVLVSGDTAAAVRSSRERAVLAKPVSLERLFATIEAID